jgi:hypothetical protein
VASRENGGAENGASAEENNQPGGVMKINNIGRRNQMATWRKWRIFEKCENNI